MAWLPTGPVRSALTVRIGGRARRRRGPRIRPGSKRSPYPDGRAVEDVNLALLLVRVVVGVTLAAHGYNKFFGGGRIAGTARWFEAIGMRPGRIHAAVAATGEIAAGLALAAGLLTSFAAAGFVGLMAVAYWVAHRGKGFFVFSDGWEYTAVLAAVAVAIAMIGPGDWSLDNVAGIADVTDGWVGLAVSLGGGLAAAALLLVLFYRPPPADA